MWATLGFEAVPEGGRGARGGGGAPLCASALLLRVLRLSRLKSCPHASRLERGGGEGEGFNAGDYRLPAGRGSGCGVAIIPKMAPSARSLLPGLADMPTSHRRLILSAPSAADRSTCSVASFIIYLGQRPRPRGGATPSSSPAWTGRPPPLPIRRWLPARGARGVAVYCPVCQHPCRARPLERHQVCVGWPHQARRTTSGIQRGCSRARCPVREGHA